jgi:hypothetical protein
MDKLVEIAKQLTTLERNAGDFHLTKIKVLENERERDIRAVRNALYRYREEPVMPETEPLDLVRWWDVRMFVKSA